MAIPLLQMYKVARYIAGRKLRGDKRYPLVLMLEPLFQCNLACSGCGKIDYPKETLQKRVGVDDGLRAVDECGAPIVSIPGGEPLIHKEMPQIVAGIVERKKFVYLCTNAILLSKHIDEYKPSTYLTFSIHLDGNKERHDESVCQEGVFEKAVAAIKLARDKGFRVTVNCTLFNGKPGFPHLLLPADPPGAGEVVQCLECPGRERRVCYANSEGGTATGCLRRKNPCVSPPMMFGCERCRTGRRNISTAAVP